MMTATTGDLAASEEKTVFLLDTETGTVWKYHPARAIRDTNGKMVAIPAAFELISVESLP